MGKLTVVAAKLSNSDRVVNTNYDFGDTAEEGAKLFGADVIYGKFKQSAIIDVQSLVRRLIKAGKTDAEIQTAVSGWKPGVSTAVRKSPEEKAKEALAGLSPDQIKALLKQYK